jgi:hypothetical protein
MTKEEFKDWVIEKGCYFETIEGINVSGNSVKIINKRFGTYYYLSLPFNEKQMPDKQICHACEQLYIAAPPSVNCDEDEEFPTASEMLSGM